MQNARAIAIYSVKTFPSESTRSPVIVRDAEVNLKRIIWPAGITPAQQAQAVQQLRSAAVLFMN